MVNAKIQNGIKLRFYYFEIKTKQEIFREFFLPQPLSEFSFYIQKRSLTMNISLFAEKIHFHT